MSEKKHVRKRGRPRTKPYHEFAEFLMEFEQLKRDYLFRKKIVESMYAAAWKKLEELDNIVQVDTPGISTAERTFSLEGVDPRFTSNKNVVRKGPRYKYHGDCFKCTTCGKESPGTDFTIDEDHDPPRIRFTLECGHRQELIIRTKPPSKCPKCDGEIQKDEEGFFCILCNWKEFGE